MNEERSVELPLNVARKLFDVWDAWWNYIGTLEPTEEQVEGGIASLLDQEDARLMDEVSEAFEPYAAQVRKLLGLRPLEPKVPALLFDGLRTYDVPTVTELWARTHPHVYQVDDPRFTGSAE